MFKALYKQFLAQIRFNFIVFQSFEKNCGKMCNLIQSFVSLPQHDAN